MGLFSLLFDLFSDKYTDSKGYRRYKDSNRLEHRYVAEKKMGYKLPKGSVVHHKDRDKTNNHPSNLHVFRNQKEHYAVHKKDAKKYGKRASYQGFKRKGFWDLF